MKTGKKIAEARRDKNLTQEQLADMLQVTRQSVSRWESDLAYPEMEKIILLSEILGVSCDYLLKDVEAKAEVLSPVTRLLRQALGKEIKLTFYSNDEDMELSNTVCKITEFDGQWMYVSYMKRKKERTKLIPISSVLAIKIVEQVEE